MSQLKKYYLFKLRGENIAQLPNKDVDMYNLLNLKTLFETGRRSRRKGRKESSRMDERK